MRRTRGQPCAQKRAQCLVQAAAAALISRRSQQENSRCREMGDPNGSSQWRSKSPPQPQVRLVDIQPLPDPAMEEPKADVRDQSSWAESGDSKPKEEPPPIFLCRLIVKYPRVSFGEWRAGEGGRGLGYVGLHVSLTFMRMIVNASFFSKIMSKFFFAKMNFIPRSCSGKHFPRI